ncbi:hypothetical protein [Streptomyces sp. N35]|uniref:hypothetical protein n=1 Tax=Streptomyces sp. N35 TaxID=2795730 RepID=UPI0018F2905E|nr:hypothetical protein [Streptomyces sp. N35]
MAVDSVFPADLLKLAEERSRLDAEIASVPHAVVVLSDNVTEVPRRRTTAAYDAELTAKLAALRERRLEVVTAIVTHEHWAQYEAGPDVVEARTRFRHLTAQPAA